MSYDFVRIPEITDESLALLAKGQQAYMYIVSSVNAVVLHILESSLAAFPAPLWANSVVQYTNIIT